MSVTRAYEAISATGTQVSRHVALARHTTWRIGGAADLFVRCSSLKKLTATVDVCRSEEVPWVVLGKGSNVLVADAGFAGCVIVLDGDFRALNLEDETRIVAGAATPMATLLNFARKAALTGLEPYTGIPGTLGGAICMNAGTASEWIGSLVRDVVVLRPGAGIARLAASDISWGYRETSIASGEIILEATLELEAGDSERISKEMERRLARRSSTQPISIPSCGSVFKNPEGKSVAELIEACGLKGYSVGDAQVSAVHPNFIVNNGKATAADVLSVIRRIHESVREEYAIDLQTEVKFLGFSS